ncbi:hypothetical protein C8J55DRAFT_507317 [Lentinula edodes]|uniref:Uncharacterized protein n=1 Tax=Lentinula lateritia TaxID=40482 RepID=A0A9W9APB6_9AGAR|nr:hypothetical protein C8J55DRAFT_507317 [Lentinula edodes]
MNHTIMIKQVIIVFFLFFAAGISNATPMPAPAPAPIDPGLQRVVAQKNSMGVANSTKLAVNGALPSPQIALLAISVPALVAGAASLAL